MALPRFEPRSFQYICGLDSDTDNFKHFVVNSLFKYSFLAQIFMKIRVVVVVV